MLNKIGFLLLFSAIIVASSCKKDDPATPEVTVTEESLVGIWEMTAVSCDDGSIKMNGTQFSTFTWVGEDLDTKLDIKANHTFETSGSYNVKTTTTTAGQTNTTTTPAPVGYSGTWSLDGNILTTIVQNDTTSGEILELTASKLKIKKHVAQTTTQSGTTIVSEQTATAEYKK